MICVAQPEPSSQSHFHGSRTSDITSARSCAVSYTKKKGVESALEIAHTSSPLSLVVTNANIISSSTEILRTELEFFMNAIKCCMRGEWYLRIFSARLMISRWFDLDNGKYVNRTRTVSKHTLLRSNHELCMTMDPGLSDLESKAHPFPRGIPYHTQVDG